MTKFTAPAVALLGVLGLSGVASAQCTLDGTVSASPFTSTSLSTCGKNISFTPFCSGGDNIAGTGATGANPSGVSIFQVNVGTNNTGLTWGVTSSTANFFPEMALISATCVAGNPCLIDDTNGTQIVAPVTAGTTASPNPGGTNQDPLPSGPYFLIVSALTGTPTACGNFVFSLAGTLPVTLQKFSVE
jgi:hypothetical protein